MSLVIEKYKQEKCRIESGIFYKNDIVQCIYYDKGTGYYCGEKVPLEILIEKNGSDWWDDIAPLSDWKEEDIIVVVGGGAWEGEGFVAFFKEAELQWVLHMEASEAFSNVKYENNKIIATANTYPHSNRIEIPTDAPDNFKFDEKYSL